MKEGPIIVVHKLEFLNYDAYRRQFDVFKRYAVLQLLTPVTANTRFQISFKHDTVDTMSINKHHTIYEMVTPIRFFRNTHIFTPMTQPHM